MAQLNLMQIIWLLTLNQEGYEINCVAAAHPVQASSVLKVNLSPQQSATLLAPLSPILGSSNFVQLSDIKSPLIPATAFIRQAVKSRFL